MLPQRTSEAFHEERGGEGAQIAPSVRAQESDVQQGAQNPHGLGDARGRLGQRPDEERRWRHVLLGEGA